jgi:hypothetical protein
MPRSDYRICRECGRHADECGPLSHTRLCGDCGVARLAASVVEQVEHDGPIFQHWRARIAASVGAVIDHGTGKAGADA